MAYGFNRDFLDVWMIEQDGEFAGVLARFYDAATLVTQDVTDTEQIRTFLGMINYRTLVCSYETAQDLSLTISEVKNGYCFNGSACDFNMQQLCEDDYYKAYALISREIPGSFSDTKEAYLSFLSDYTFRERRGLARGVCSYCDDIIASTALTSSETDNAAVISGVACDKSCQKKGLGKATVLSLINSLKKENKTAYVIALNESAEGFYEHIGFDKVEKIAFIERKSYV